jgi:hypothetical protein
MFSGMTSMRAQHLPFSSLAALTIFVIRVGNRELLYTIVSFRGPGSVIGIATGYRLDGPGIQSPLGPIQPPVQWVPAISRG